MSQHQSPSLSPHHQSSNRIIKSQSTSDRLAALKSRVAAAVESSVAKKPTGGLNVSLHPALEDLSPWNPLVAHNSAAKTSSRQGRGAAQTPSSSGGKSFLRTRHGSDVQSNPYYEKTAGGNGHAAGLERPARNLQFNAKGKYIQQGNVLRRQTALEAMKKRIAAQTRRAGIEDDREVVESWLITEPPKIEWWDEGILGEGGYSCVGDEARLEVTLAESAISSLVQHPVPLEPPQDRNIPAPKPMFLTSKEQAKLRRQRRMAALKEQQAKIRLGLEPAPPPKVKKGNLMRVLGEEAVKDPTAVEARVNREIAERHYSHERANEERKLTKDQRAAKLIANQSKDRSKGIHMLVFRIGSLANGQHRYKVSVNAEELGLTGTCILHPRFCLVIVEGGEWATTRYKRLLLSRINWTENAPPRSTDLNETHCREWLAAVDKEGKLKDMSQNTCALIFEGEIKAAVFRKWGTRISETDAEAREILSRVKLENFWLLAKSESSK